MEEILSNPSIETLFRNACNYDGVLQQEALEARNTKWAKNPLIPPWVKPEDVGLDAFFTRSDVARRCYNILLKHMRADCADPGSYRFIEPSAGTGAFYDLLPESRRIGLDIMPHRYDYMQTDFLSWLPPEDGLPSAIVGNPPFGYRGWLALAFMNHAARFADYVGMILPMSFQSDGKGSPKRRVNGLRLQLTEYLPPDAFRDIKEPLENRVEGRDRRECGEICS